MGLDAGVAAVDVAGEEQEQRGDWRQTSHPASDSWVFPL